MTVRPVVIVHVHIAVVEVQVASVRTTNRTTPIVTVATHIVKRAIAIIPVATCCLK